MKKNFNFCIVTLAALFASSAAYSQNTQQPASNMVIINRNRNPVLDMVKSFGLGLTSGVMMSSLKSSLQYPAVASILGLNVLAVNVGDCNYFNKSVEINGWDVSIGTADGSEQESVEIETSGSKISAPESIFIIKVKEGAPTGFQTTLYLFAHMAGMAVAKSVLLPNTK